MDILHSTSFVALPEEQKQNTTVKLQKYFYNFVLHRVSDKLPAEEINGIQRTPLVSISSENKLTSLLNSMPFLIGDLELLLIEEAEKIKQNPTLLT